MHSLYVTLLAGLLVVPTASRAEVPGLVRLRSDFGVAETVARLEAELGKAEAVVVAKVDHAAGATKVGATLRPTVVVIFGNPKIGTPLMVCSQTMGIDLPLKALVWEDERGRIWIGYDDPQYLADRHGAGPCGDAVARMSAKLRSLAGAAGGTSAGAR